MKYRAWVDEKCADCVYFAEGKCRRLPPSVTISIDSINHGSMRDTRYPMVVGLPACAEFVKLEKGGD